jgi:hypothetical protein
LTHLERYKKSSKGYKGFNNSEQSNVLEKKGTFLGIIKKIKKKITSFKDAQACA